MRDPAQLLQVSPAGRELLAAAHDPESPIRGLNMLAVFGGHLDAGNLSEQVRSLLFEGLEHQKLFTFDTDVLINYRSRRPHIIFDGERFTDYVKPELTLEVVKDQAGKPFLLLSGPEPDYQWETFVAAVQLIVEQLDVKMITLVDAIPLPVPHTRPLGVTTHGNKKEILEGLSTWSPKARMLSGVSQLLEVRLSEDGLDVTGYTLHIPHYLADATYPQAAVAALEYIAATMELQLPTDQLREAGREVDAQLALQTRQSPQIAAMVESLEERFDAHQPQQVRSLLLPPDQQIPDAEEIGAQFEQFLADHDAEQAEAHGLGPTSDESDGQLTLDLPSCSEQQNPVDGAEDTEPGSDGTNDR